MEREVYRLEAEAVAVAEFESEGKRLFKRWQDLVKSQARHEKQLERGIEERRAELRRVDGAIIVADLRNEARKREADQRADAAQTDPSWPSSRAAGVVGAAGAIAAGSPAAGAGEVLGEALLRGLRGGNGEADRAWPLPSELGEMWRVAAELESAYETCPAVQRPEVGQGAAALLGGLTGWGAVAPSVRQGLAVQDTCEAADQISTWLRSGNAQGAEEARAVKRKEKLAALSRDIRRAKERRTQVHAACTSMYDSLEHAAEVVRGLQEQREVLLADVSRAFDWAMAGRKVQGVRRQSVARSGSRRPSAMGDGPLAAASSKSTTTLGPDHTPKRDRPRARTADVSKTRTMSESSGRTADTHVDDDEDVEEPRFLTLPQLKGWIAEVQASHTSQEVREAEDPWPALLRRLRHRVSHYRSEGQGLRAAVATAQATAKLRPLSAPQEQRRALGKVHRQYQQLLGKTDDFAVEALRSVEAWASWASSTETLLLSTAAMTNPEEFINPPLMSAAPDPIRSGSQRLRALVQDIMGTISGGRGGSAAAAAGAGSGGSATAGGTPAVVGDTTPSVSASGGVGSGAGGSGRGSGGDGGGGRCCGAEEAATPRRSGAEAAAAEAVATAAALAANAIPRPPSPGAGRGRRAKSYCSSTFQRTIHPTNARSTFHGSPGSDMAEAIRQAIVGGDGGTFSRQDSATLDLSPSSLQHPEP